MVYAASVAAERDEMLVKPQRSRVQDQAGDAGLLGGFAKRGAEPM